MLLTPFGVLNNGHRGRLKKGGYLEPMPDWPRGKSKQYADLMNDWLIMVKDNVWPAWENGQWKGASAQNKENSAKEELALAVRLYHGAGGEPDILGELPDLKNAPNDSNRNQEWHYRIEDALVLDRRFEFVEPSGVSFNFRASRTIGSNYLVYDPNVAIRGFEQLFWGRMRQIEPAIFDIKQLLQRPRPWNAAALLGVDGFRWTTADGLTHTGVHPSLLSGHCIQGILGGCCVFDALLDDGKTLDPDQKEALQKYMVDWGDRRVFAGVHYMTDNIGSWTLARQIIPHLFRNADQVEAFALEAIMQHSHVFKHVLQHFPYDSPAKGMLLHYFPEVVPA